MISTTAAIPRRLPRQGAGRIADWGGFAKRKAESKARGKLRGIGLCTYVEACGLAPSRIASRLGVRGGLFESATVRVHPTGHVTVLIGTHNHGQGHETTFAQIVSEKLGIPAENVEIVFGDTDKVQFGLGTYGSRSLAVGGSALVKASRQGHRQGQEDRRAHARGQRTGHRVRGRRRSRSPAPTARKPSATSRCAAYVPGQLSARDARAGPRGAGVLRSGELHLSRRRAYRRSRDRPGDRRRSSLRDLRRGRRRRHGHQSDDRRGPDSTAASRKASARRCSRTASTTRRRASCCPARSWTTACRAPTTCRT